jgi:hypothetical protein
VANGLAVHRVFASEASGCARFTGYMAVQSLHEMLLALDEPYRILLRDPLGDLAHKERRSLLAMSIITIVLVKGQFIASRIVVSGVELNAENQAPLPVFLAAIILYFVVTFALYAAPDYMVLWYNENFSARHVSQTFGVSHRTFVVALCLFWLRFAVETGVPLAVGFFALLTVWGNNPVLPAHPLWIAMPGWPPVLR